jgi:hypothetical protein
MRPFIRIHSTTYTIAQLLFFAIEVVVRFTLLNLDRRAASDGVVVCTRRRPRNRHQQQECAREKEESCEMTTTNRPSVIFD